MKKLKLLGIAACIMLMPLINYGAMVQLIHNAPTENLDIYINNQLQFPNIIFRHGTPFILLPDGEWNLQIASAGSNDFLANFPISLQKDSTYIYMIGGEKENLQLFTQRSHRQYADLAQHIGFTFVHGAVGEEVVQLSTHEQTIFEELSFGKFSPFINITTQKFDIAVERQLDQTAMIANRMNFSFWEGGSAVIFTSGYSDGREPHLKTYAILSNGSSFPLEEIILPHDHRKIKMQLIQNSVHKVFDLYLNDELFVDDFNFREATAFLDFPKGEYFSIGVAPANSRSFNDIKEYFTFKLDDQQPYIAFLNTTEDGASTLMQLRDAIPEAPNASSLALGFSQGAFQLPTVDIYIDGHRMSSNVDLWEITEFHSLPSRSFQIDLTSTQQSEVILHSYRANLKNWRGQSGMLYTSGSAETNNFTLQVVFPDTTFSLPSIQNSNDDHIEQREEAIATIRMDATLFNSTIDCFVQTEEAVEISLSLVDAEGKIVWQETKGYQSPGKHLYKIDIHQLPTGIYFLQSRIGDEILSKKIVKSQL